jgi:acylphosphatase
MADAGRADTVRYGVIVHGFVQGVWFRESCRRQASALGVSGWVRNCADGTVEAHFEGPERAVAQAVAWCRSGPPAAEVTGVDVTAEEPEGALGFQVR